MPVKAWNLRWYTPKFILGVLVACALLLTPLALALLSTPARAAANSTINFQARLMNSTGSIVSDGFYNVEFKIYDAATSSGSSQGSCTGDANCLWTETYYDTNGATAGNDFRIRVANGYLTVSLGSRTAFPSTINWDQQLWITMNVGGTAQTATPTYDGEMTPRLALTAVPFAFRAGALAGGTGANTTILDTGTPSGNNTLHLPAESGTLCVQNSANCGFVTGASTNFIQNTTTVQDPANFNIRSGSTSAVTGVLQGANGQVADLFDVQTWDGAIATTVFGVNHVGDLATQNIRLAPDKSIGLPSGTGTYTQAYENTTGIAATITATDSASSGQISTVQGVLIDLVGTSNGAGSNTLYGLNFGNVTAATNNVFHGINFGTGFNDLLRYNGNALISGAGKLQDVAIDSSLTYSNLQKVGVLSAGSITTGFGTISTGNNISTTAAVQGGTGTFTGANALTLGTASTNTGVIIFRGQGGSGTLALSGPTTPNAGNYTLTIPAITGNANVCTDNSVCSGYQAAGSYANTALSNLVSVAINTSLLPGNTGVDLGSSSAPFRDLYLGGTATNNFHFTGTAGGARTITLDDLSGHLALLQTAGSSTAQTGDINASGTVIAGTALQGTLVKSANATGATSAITVQSGDSTSSGNTGGVTIVSGNATSGNSGGVNVDSGTASGTTGTVTIGGTNASGVTLGHSGVTTSSAGALSVAANQNFSLLSGSGTLTQTYTNTTGTGATFAATDSASSGTTTLQGVAINLTGTANAGGSNTLTGLNFGNVAAAANNTYYGINFGTGFTDLLRYNGNQLISGAGKLQDAAIDSTVTYNNLQKVGALNTGSIGGSFGAISTGNNISTTAAIQGGTGTFTDANALTLGTSTTNTGAIVFKGQGGSGTLTLSGPTTPNTGNYTLTIPAITANANLCTDNSICSGYQAAGSYANTALSNLVSVAINTSLLPGNTSVDLGSGSAPFRDLYLGGTATNNFKFTGTATNARTLTLDDLSGSIALVQTAGSSTAQTGDINASGTLIASTALQGTMFRSANSAGASSAITFKSGDTTGGSGLTTGSVAIKSGDGSGTDTNSGNITIDNGSKSGSGTAGTISIGTVNASGISIGRTGVTTSNAGALTVSQLLTANGGVTVAANQNLALNSGTGVFSQAYSNSSTGSAQTLGATNSNSGGSSVAVNGESITLVGTATSGGINSNTAINFVDPAAATNNNFYGLNFTGTGYTDVLRVNGSQIISGAGKIQNAAIDSSVTYSNLTKVGTLTTGTLGAGFTTVAATVGGTGQSSYAVGDLLYADTTNSLARLADVATGSCLISGGANTAPVWGACPGVTTIGAIDTPTTSANGAHISGSTLYLQTATTSVPGLVSTANQSFAGDKTFTGNVLIQGTTGLTFSTGVGGDITFANSEKIDNDTNGQINLQADTGALTLLLTGAAANLTNSAGTLTLNSFNNVLTVDSSDTTLSATGIGTINLANSVALTTGATTRFTLDNSNNLYLGNGTSAAAPNDFKIQGTASTTGGVVGGVITLQGGNATAGNTNGGGVSISGGSGAGTGVLGLVKLAPTTFISSGSTQTFNGGSGCPSCSVTGVDTYSTIAVNATTIGLSINIPVPNAANQIVGRIIYITGVSGSSDFTIVLGGTSIAIGMKANSTATLIWNGTGWTAAGASSSTDLQSAYNNTLTSAGGAELVVSNGSNANGLTIRDSLTSPISGAGNGTLLEVQTGQAASLFSVNSSVTDYSNNGGAESTFGAEWSAIPSSGATVSRNTNTTYIATGTGSVSIATNTSAGSGAANKLTTTLTANLRYNVSFATKLTAGSAAFTDIDVEFSKDGTTTAMTACSNYSTQTAATSVWSKVNCTFTAPSSGITSSNAIFIRQTASGTSRTFYTDNLSVTISADLNYATDGGVDDNTNFTTNWTAVAGTGATVTAIRSTTNGNDTSDSAEAHITVGGSGGNNGIRNKLSINPLTGTLYRISVYASSSTAMTDFTVRYSRDGGTNFDACVDYNSQSLSGTITSFKQITCYVTTSGTAPSNPYVYFTESGTGVRDIYVDTFTMSIASNAVPNVQIGGGVNGGPTTLFTLDRAGSAPIAANNDALLGSMYYDTTLGKLQCYEADGWGACGSSPDVIVTLSPEYTNAVLHGPSGGTIGVGTMTSDICSDALNINDGSSSQPTICGSNETYNFYKWTSPQPTAQTYGIYVTYQLPTTFKSFASGSTSVMGRTDNGPSGGSATAAYKVYKNNSSSGLSQCGSTVSISSGSVSSWQIGLASGAADPSTCSFAPGDSIVFEIDMTASKDANTYVGNLGFTFSNK